MRRLLTWLFALVVAGTLTGSLSSLASAAGVGQEMAMQGEDIDDGQVGDVDDGQVGDADDGQVGDVDDGAVGDVDHGAVDNIDDGAVDHVDNGQVGEGNH